MHTTHLATILAVHMQGHGLLHFHINGAAVPQSEALQVLLLPHDKDRQLEECHPSGDTRSHARGQKPVIRLCPGGHGDTAALPTGVHAGQEDQLVDPENIFHISVEDHPSAGGLHGEELLHRKQEIDQLTQTKAIQELLLPGAMGRLADLCIQTNPCGYAEGSRPAVIRGGAAQIGPLWLIAVQYPEQRRHGFLRQSKAPGEIISRAGRDHPHHGTVKIRDAVQHIIYGPVSANHHKLHRILPGAVAFHKLRGELCGIACALCLPCTIRNVQLLQ